MQATVRLVLKSHGTGHTRPVARSPFGRWMALINGMQERSVTMSGRTTWSFLLPVLAILLVLAVGVVILVSVGLRQTDVLHQIILVGLGVVLFGFGVMLLTLAVAELSRKARKAH